VPVKAHSDRHIIAYLAFISFLLAFGIDTVLPAFDEIRVDFDLASGSSDVSKIVTFYLVGVALGQLLWGPISDRFGRAPTVLAGVSVYGGGALLAAIAPSFGWILLARFIWGLGAASTMVLYTAIARDLYEGDQMARVLQIVTAVFLIGPMVAPGFGELLLQTGYWQIIFASAAVLALIAIAWSRVIGETLDPTNRRELNPRDTIAGFRAVFASPAARGYMLAMTFASGGFYIYLGSGQPIIDEIYGHGDLFAVVFAVGAIVMGVGLVLSSRLTARVGARQVVKIAAAAMTATSGLGVLLAISSDGVPSLWLWGSTTIVSLTLMTVMTPTGMSLALRPLEHMAGTAAAVIGFATQGGGAALAALVNREIDGTVTPMSVGGVVYGAVTIMFLASAIRADPLPVS
jgi:DHA1 family bicyclomycin/chloramphenicol resistance-like MFS transporter